MKHFTIERPDGKAQKGVNLDHLYQKIMGKAKDFWYHDNGQCIIRYYQDSTDWPNESISELVIRASWGCDQFFLSCYSGKLLLSLYDDTMLTEYLSIVNGDEYSAGLFLPMELAWTAICDFLQNGKPSSSVT